MEACHNNGIKQWNSVAQTAQAIQCLFVLPLRTLDLMQRQ